MVLYVAAPSTVVIVQVKMAVAEQGSADYEWEFIEPPAPEFDCKICHNVLREPFLTSCCGNHFCQACLDPAVKDGKPCPSCNEGRFVTVLDKKTRRKILSFDVRCPMWRRGCKWVGELGERCGHLDEKSGECQFVDVNCSNACGGCVQRRELAAHLEQACPKRPYVCGYCPFEATFDVVTSQHWLVCGYFPLPCPNGCNAGTVERQNLEQHVKECSFQEVECDFSYSGCQAKLQRKDFAQHMAENVQNHMRMTQRKLEEQAVEIREIFERDLQGKESEIIELQQANANLQEKLRKGSQEKEDGAIELGQMNIDLQERGSREIKELKEENAGFRQAITDLQEAFGKRFQEKDTEIAQLQQAVTDLQEKFKKDFQEKEEEIVELRQRNSNLHEKEIAQLQQANVDLQEKMKGVLDQKDRQIAEVQEALKQKDEQMAAQLRKKDGRISQLEASLRKTTKHEDWVFTMPCYNPSAHCKWESAPCFYTHFEGYKLQLQASSDPKARQMSVQLHVWHGDFDSKLKWPLKATVALQLIDRTGSHLPYEMSVQGAGGPAFYQHISVQLCWKPFITHTALEKYAYSDSLCFRVVSVNWD